MSDVEAVTKLLELGGRPLPREDNAGGNGGGNGAQPLPRAIDRPPQPPHDIPRHQGVRCDYCHRVSFLGTRYKCGHCADYDLCETCYGRKHLTGHDEQHLFIAVTYPLAGGAHNRPLLDGFGGPVRPVPPALHPIAPIAPMGVPEQPHPVNQHGLPLHPPQMR